MIQYNDNYCSKSVFQHLNVFKDTNFLENEQTGSTGQKDTVYTKKNGLRMTEVSWLLNR